MGLSLDGLSSGLDTTTLINSLMQVEAIPQNILKNKAKSTQTMIAALQALNTKVADLAKVTGKIADSKSLQFLSTSSSSESLKVSTLTGAGPGSLKFTVDRLATSQQAVTDVLGEWDTDSVTLTAADGTETVITAKSNSLDDIASAINDSEAGVSAVKVPAGNGLYRLQLTSTETGSQNGFTVSGTTVAITQIRAAQDAEITIWSGTDAEQKATSATNTFSSLLPAVEVTVSETSSQPVTLAVTRDAEATSKAAEELVGSLNSLFGFISTNTAVSTGISGATSGMIFTGDSTVRTVKQRITDAAIMPIDGKSPSEIGISVTRNGTIEFDSAKFSKAMADNPKYVEGVLGAIAGRVAEVAEGISDKRDGMIASRIQGQESVSKRLDNQILEWDRRLDSREATLKKIYSALEVQLSNLNSQQSYLASQLAALPTQEKK